MDENKYKQLRKTMFHHLKMAEKRLETASLILEREVYVDAVPILFKTVAAAIRILLQFKQKPIADFQENIKSLENELKEEKLWDKNTIKLFHSLNKLNKKYIAEIEFECDGNAVKNIFEETNNFLARTRKFLKIQLSTPRERIIKKRVKKIFLFGSIFISSLLIIFFLITPGINKFGTKHGFLAHYYNNIYLEEPAAVEKIDEEIDFVWGSFKPHKEIKGKFSIRWEGRIKIDKSDNYNFYVLSDEGVRLFLDEKVLLDTWSAQTRTMNNTCNVTLEKGFHKIKLEYYFNQQHADIKLQWSSSSFKKTIVRNKFLYPIIAK